MAMKEPPSSAEAGVGWDALVADAVFVGLETAVQAFRAAIDEGESRR